MSNDNDKAGAGSVGEAYKSRRSALAWLVALVTKDRTTAELVKAARWRRKRKPFRDEVLDEGL